MPRFGHFLDQAFFESASRMGDICDIDDDFDEPMDDGKGATAASPRRLFTMHALATIKMIGQALAVDTLLFSNDQSSATFHKYAKMLKDADLSSEDVRPGVSLTETMITCKWVCLAAHLGPLSVANQHSVPRGSTSHGSGPSATTHNGC